MKSGKRYLVGKPYYTQKGMAGRGTRGYVALDLETGRFVWLKDAWRAAYDLVDKEGDILQRLKDANIKHVPTLVCHGDLLGQTTVSYDKWSTFFPGKKCPMKPHRHYRLVVKEVGKPLHEFEDGAHLVLCMLSVVIGMLGPP